MHDSVKEPMLFKIGRPSLPLDLDRSRSRPRSYIGSFTSLLLIYFTSVLEVVSLQSTLDYRHTVSLTAVLVMHAKPCKLIASCKSRQARPRLDP